MSQVDFNAQIQNIARMQQEQEMIGAIAILLIVAIIAIPLWIIAMKAMKRDDEKKRNTPHIRKEPEL